MTDIFISYGHEDHAAAKRFADAFAAEGLSVWLDTAIRSGEAFDEMIEAALRSAKAVVVLWSPRSVVSRWVRAEATLADCYKTLVPCTIEACELPIMFQLTQTAELSQWRGDTADASWQAFLTSVKRFIEREDAVSSPRPKDELNKAAFTVGDAQGDLRLLVLDFENRTDDPSLDAVCCDLADDLRHILAGFRALSVYGRATSRRMSGGATGVPQATHVLDATLRASPGPAEIRLQLQDARTGRLLWVDRQPCEQGKPPSLRPSTAADVAGALGISGTPLLLSHSVNPAALELYLEARRIAGPGETRTRCIAHYEAALRIAPDFAAAWAGLAQSLANSCRYDTRNEPFETLASRAKITAMRALRLDPQAALAWSALSILEPYAAYGRREAQLDRAIAAAPNDAELLRQRGEAAHTVGRFHEAHRFMQRAFEIDSNNILVRQNHAMTLSEVGPLADCVDAYAAGRRQMPDFAWFFIADPWLIAAHSGDWAIVDRISPIAEAANLPELESVKWEISALREPSNESRNIVMSAAERSLAKRGFVNISTLVFAANLGMVAKTFEWVNRSDYSHIFRADGGVTDTKGHYQGLLLGITNRAMQAEPGFVDLCSKIGLTRYWTETDRWPDCAEALQARYGFVDLAKQNLGPEIAVADDF